MLRTIFLQYTFLSGKSKAEEAKGYAENIVEPSP